MLCAVLAAGCFFTTPEAEARFGKAGGSRSSSGASSSSGSNSSTGSSTSAGASSSGGSRVSSGSSGWRFHAHRTDSPRRRHRATPVGQEPDGAPSNNGGGNPDPDSVRPVILPRPVWVPAFAGAYSRRSRWVTRQEADEPNRSLLVRMGVEGLALREGGALGFGLGIEGRRWGVSTRLTAMNLRADDGSDETDHLRLAEANVTLAAYASERGRLRVEGGVAWVHAPDVIFIGPNMALSFERCLCGVLDLEGRVQWVPFPHLQLDGQLGLAVHLGMLTLRGGWRKLLLDDRGYPSGERHRDSMGGPFAGLGLSF
jgi:hypothetical protein